MNSSQQAAASDNKKYGKKLAGFTLLTTLVVVVIVFAAVLYGGDYIKLKLLDQYIHEIPGIVMERDEELETRSRVFEEDVVSRGELGAKIYKEYSGLEETEKLEHIRDMISADSVSLINEDGTIIDTTGIVSPMEIFENQLKTLEPHKVFFEIYPDASNDSAAEEKNDGNAIVMFPVEEEDDRRLVFEFSCKPLLDLYNAIGGWPVVLERMLSGMDAYAFVQIGEDAPVGYPLDDFTETERAQALNEVSGILQKRSRFHSIGDESSYALVSFQGRASLAVLLPYQEHDANALIIVSLWDFISTAVFTAATLSIFVVFSMILFSIYVFRQAVQKNTEEGRKKVLSELRRSTFPGLLFMIIAIGCFSVMLIALESRSNITFIGTSKQLSLQNEIEWHDNLTKKIKSSYADIYRSRTQAFAKFLMEHKEYRTRSDLQVFSKILRADYLMLFDKNGNEIVSSNSYTGFSVNGSDPNLSEEYRAMVMGYPFVVAGPAEDPYTGDKQIGAAILMTRDNEQADGFLLAVYNAASLNAELKKANLENTVNSFAVAEGYKAAVVDKETGLFLAHTDANMIGINAEYYLPAEVYAEDYAGFADYDGISMYVSGVMSSGKSVLFMLPSRPDTKESFIVLLMIVVLLLMIAFFYCTKVCSLAADEAMQEPVNVENEIYGKRESLSVFFHGYTIFFTVLAAITALAAYSLVWPAFVFVFSGLWSRGVHLFSLWAALFFLSGTLCVVLLIRKMISRAERRADYRTRSVLRLLDNLVAYAAGFFIIAKILYMFGANTEALLASAGILSIAVGMGSKDMVADILAGLFLLVEDSIHLGDEVSIDKFNGRVTDMGIRTIKVTDASQNTMVLNNSKIKSVVNMSGQKASCVLEYPVKSSLNAEEIEKMLRKAADAASEAMPELYGSLQLDEIHGSSPESRTARLSYTCSEIVREAIAKQLQEFLDKYMQQEMEKIISNK